MIHLPPEVRTWVARGHESLWREIYARQIVWEYDSRYGRTPRSHWDKNSAQRLWAIGRVLKYAVWEDIRRLLSVEDIEDALHIQTFPRKSVRY